MERLKHSFYSRQFANGARGGNRGFDEESQHNFLHKTIDMLPANNSPMAEIKEQVLEESVSQSYNLEHNVIVPDKFKLYNM